MGRMMDDDVKHAIFEAILSNRKIDAIKQLREASGLGLAEAKAIVEQLDACLLRDGIDSPEADQLLAGAGGAASPGDAAADDDNEQLLALVRAGKKIEAIRMYRETHRVGLKDAKQAVDAMARAAGIPSKGGCAGMILLLMIIGAGGLLFTMRELIGSMS